ncbi:MAG TPA: response regulator [Verrucomicrobiae bacterium]|nr:response regulator [Verrucomicrobiae bacterium]
MARILVIEDSSEYREFIGELLRLCGYELLEADDGEPGIRLADEAAPDLIICDLHLPRVDGFCTLETIRKHERGRRVPFIFLSGDSDPLHMHRGLDLGAEAYLVKPVSANEFVLEVRRLLPNGNGQSTHPASVQIPSASLPHTASL